MRPSRIDFTRTMKFFRIVSLLLLILISTIAGRKYVDTKLRGSSETQDVASIYNRYSNQENTQQNPVIIIPGYLGSRLEHKGEKPIAWGAFTRNSLNPSKPKQAKKLALPIAPDTAITELSDEVYSTGILDSVQVKISGFKTEQSVYKNLLSAFNASGYHRKTTDSKKRFEFHYDWRKDNVVIAQQLHKFITAKKAEVEADRLEKFGDNAKPVKFDIVAHSMGGLIARYYLRYGDQPLADAKIDWAGSEYVERLLLIAPPNLGSLKSLLGATDGYQAHPMLPKYSGAILSTFPSTYQLFPRDRHNKVVDENGRPISIYDAKLWQQKQWGFFNPSNAKILAALLPNHTAKERETKALKFLTHCLERAHKFHEALDRQADQKPSGLEMYLFSGDSIATPAKLKALPFSKKNKSSFAISDWLPGDDTVTRKSSLSDERTQENWQPTIVTTVDFEDAYFVSADHFGLTKNGVIFDTLLHILLEKPRL